MLVNVSYKVLSGKVIDNYTETLSGWRNKEVEWNKVYRITNKSNVQYSPYKWNNGVKKPKQFDNSKQDIIVLDVDDGLTISQIQKMLRKYKFLIATTKSHQQDKKGVICDRFRVVLPAINIPKDFDVYKRTIELMFPFNDEQTLTKTGAFLGNDEAIHIYNDGEMIDCHKASILAEEQIEQERIEKEEKKIDVDLLPIGNSSLDFIKENLDFEVVCDVLESLGYDIVINKVALRSERTPSTKIYKDGGMYDYGTGRAYDIFQVLIDFKGFNFGDAMRYIRGFI
jgi:hypothetical protein